MAAALGSLLRSRTLSWMVVLFDRARRFLIEGQAVKNGNEHQRGSSAASGTAAGSAVKINGSGNSISAAQGISKEHGFSASINASIKL